VTYAQGRLVLWNRGIGSAVADCLENLQSGKFNRLAIANPVTAPYGFAATQVLDKLGLTDHVSEKLVRGSNIAQTFQFVDTGNAQFGLVALSQLSGREAGAGECRWTVPETWHDPIEQQLVLLKRAAGNNAAQEFLAYLKGESARTIIRRFGYTVP